MNFLKLYESYQMGFLFGQRFPGVVRAIFKIFKGIALLLSFGLWWGLLSGGVDSWLGETPMVQVAIIVYLLIVVGGLVWFMVLKATKNIDTFKNIPLFKIYHRVILIASLAFGIVLGMDESSPFYVVIGLFLGYFYIHMPELVYIFAEAFINKVKKMKGGR